MAQRVWSLISRALRAAVASTSSLLLTFMFIIGLGIFGNPHAGGEFIETLWKMLLAVAGSTIILAVIYYTKNNRCEQDAFIKWYADLWDAVRNSRFLTILALLGTSVLMSLLNLSFWPAVAQGITNMLQAGLQLILFAFLIWLGFHILSAYLAGKKKK